MKKTLLIVGIFAIAMGMLESAVVIYLRAMSYPDGFCFPIQKLDMNLSLVELSREAATIIMLIGIGRLVGKNFNSRFAIFIFSFAVWDIFYYIFLKIFLNWPESVFTWDILFLIPFVWVGPVWAPLLLSASMIYFSVILLEINQLGSIPLGRMNWLLMILGSAVCIFSFGYDYFQFAIETIPNFKIRDVFNIDLFFDLNYVPITFPFLLFFIGYGLIITGVVRYLNYSIFTKKQTNYAQLF